jgi:hypothetical protein
MEVDIQLEMNFSPALSIPVVVAMEGLMKLRCFQYFRCPLSILVVVAMMLIEGLMKLRYFQYYRWMQVMAHSYSYWTYFLN